MSSYHCSNVSVPVMTSDTKRKWRWTSKSFLASTHTNKVLKLDYPVVITQDGANDQERTNDVSSGGHSQRDNRYRTGVAARMRRSGSKLLSRVGIQQKGGSIQICVIFCRSLIMSRY